jgi:hypothetical protein
MRIKQQHLSRVRKKCTTRHDIPRFYEIHEELVHRRRQTEVIYVKRPRLSEMEQSRRYESVLALNLLNLSGENIFI